MEQKHTLEENGYYAQVTDQLIENIGYQMIRRNWSMKTLADKAFGFPFSLKHCNHNGTAGRNGIVDGIYHHIERTDQADGRYRLPTGGADHRSCQYTDTENEK